MAYGGTFDVLTPARRLPMSFPKGPREQIERISNN